ncbi:hypothetical protein [Microbacterium sp.]|uniref:hypothetical protein n=1 Tax=Microbacterium sp. TaxID=51671 RepID=UPI0028999F78|nr:hypothetical protein [Microbacterium sp.]
MHPSSLPSPDAVLAALAAARGLVRDARADAADLRLRAMGIADGTRWRSRAADDYRAAMDEFIGRLDLLVHRLGACDGHLAAMQRTESAAALTSAGVRP